MIRNIIRNRRRRILAAAGTLALCATLAYAAWLTEGTGPAQGKVAELAALTVELGDTPAAGECTPGNTCPAYLKVTNPNTPLVVTRVAQAGPFTTIGSSCAADNFSVEDRSGLSIPLPSGTSQVTVPGVFRMVASPADECQGTTFSVPFTVTASTP